jgi:hypothetical protein
MWTKNLQLQRQAERVDQLEAAAGKALAALRDGEAETAAELLLAAVDPLA